MIHHDQCPLCSSGNITGRMICTDHFISREDFPLFECHDCGLVFTQDHPDENEIGRYYESAGYISHSDTSRGLVNKLYHTVRRLMLRRKRNIINSVTGLTSGKLLDIGSGTGHFAAEMKRAGWDASGIEINEKARNFAKTTFELEVKAPDEIMTLGKNSFDCITLWHVLEHFHDPGKYFSDIQVLLKARGTCVVALPNCSSSDAVHYGRYWAAYDVPRHLRHYTPKTFRHLAGQNGFRVERILVLPFDVFYISMLSEKYRGSRLSVVTGLLKALLFSTETLFNREKSSSVIYILKKKAD